MPVPIWMVQVTAAQDRESRTFNVLAPAANREAAVDLVKSKLAKLGWAQIVSGRSGLLADDAEDRASGALLDAILSARDGHVSIVRYVPDQH